MHFVDVIRSLHHHWRASVAILVLAGTALGVFLFLREEVRADTRYYVYVRLSVPTYSEDGVAPEGVPHVLLNGHGGIANDPSITGAALIASGLDETAGGIGIDGRQEGDIEFGFGEEGEGLQAGILTFSVVGPDIAEARLVANNWASTFTARRRAIVAADATVERDVARRSVDVLRTRLGQVEGELRAIDPGLPERLDGATTGVLGDEKEPPVIALPTGTPLETLLLAYERKGLIDRIRDTQREYASASLDTLVTRSFSTVIERSAPQQLSPPNSSPLVPILLIVGAGLLLAVGVPVLLDRFDHSIRDPKTASAALAAPVFSTIPAATRANRTEVAEPGSARGDAFSTLAAASVATDQLPRAIVVTSPVGRIQDGVAANFAAALAGLGLRVALVATDLRQAWFLEGADAEGAPTLPDLLSLAHAGQFNGQVADSLVPTPFANLAVVAPGDTGTDALLDGLPSLLEALSDAGVDVTVIAAPAMLEEPSATILAWSTRSVLWVVEVGEVTEHEAREAASRLALTGATPFGVALVDARR